MGNIREFLKNNRLYAVLLVFVITVNCLAVLGKLSPEKNTGGAVSKPDKVKSAVIFSKKQMEARKEKIFSLLHKNPFLYAFLALLNLFMLFLILLGMIFDASLAYLWLKNGKVNIPSVPRDGPLWTIGDVLRVVLIFLSLGYVFILLEELTSGSFPLIRDRNLSMILDTLMMNIVGISVVFYFVRIKYGQDLSTIGLHARNVFSNIGCAFAGYIALIPVLLVIMTVTFFVIKAIHYEPPVQPIVEVFIKEKSASVLGISAVFAAVFGPIAEEIFFRGFLYSAIKKRTGVLWAMIITSLIFSVLHAHPVGLVPIMALGMLLAYLYERTGSLVAPITVHIIHNIGMVTLVFIAKYLGT